jgi:AcrR family transcriptional regulator
MARAKSEEKRDAILTAAARMIAERGLSASTACIAKTADVAEGSVFTYFTNKDDLLNHLYLQLRLQLSDVMRATHPECSSIRGQTSQVWCKYIDWGTDYPDKWRTLAQLTVSNRVTDRVRSSGMRAFGDVSALLERGITSGELRDHPAAFMLAVMGALAETTLDFIRHDPSRAEQYRVSGFNVLWRAIARDGC